MPTSSDHYSRIYSSQAAAYHRLIAAEDVDDASAEAEPEAGVAVAAVVFLAAPEETEHLFTVVLAETGVFVGDAD